MDRLASEGIAGSARTVPEGFEPGSDVANLSILGYNPKKYYSGRAPIEAAYRGISLGPEDVAYRCNLVTLNYPSSGDRKQATMEDYSAGHITTEEASALIRAIDNGLGTKDIRFYPGMSYRHLMIWKNGKDRIRCTPPHDISGKKTGPFLPQGRGAEVILTLMEQSHDILMNSAVNQKRIRKALNPATSIWLWGQGKRLTVPTFEEKYGLKGALISAVDLTKGLGIAAGFDVLNVKGATGYIDTNYAGKADAALKALRTCDFVYVHVEAPDEAGHNGDVRAKIQAIEDFDKKIVGPIVEGLKRFDSFRVLLMPDHFTPVRARTHTADPVPFVIYDSRDRVPGRTGRVHAYSERICRMSGLPVFDQGYRLMDFFLRGR
jgi:2,3-bisphosphoglycerate-independent phosphoglycerate mutase